MAKWMICDYIHPGYGNLIRAWSLRLAKKERAKLNQRIDSLELYGTDLIPGIVAPTGVASILKLKIHGKVQLRPMLCEGPGVATFTFLLGAKEVQDAYDPPGAPQTAAEYRKDLFANSKTRQIPHERIN
jgi:hypothetical protein